MAESYSVKAILSATDKGFSSTLKGCASTLDKIDSKISGFSFGLLTGAGQAAFNALASGASSLIGEIDSSNAAWKTFTKNMQIVGKSEGEINSVKKELQSFAEQTVYSSSDMAQTFAQLEAVGTKNTAKLVKGFGGLAAAAEDPQQAMKTLSTQATQMAAKPTVAWADFKLMLEQSPAGMAAVAKKMGMSTAELVTKIQDGEVKTNDFLDAIAEVGTSKEFADMATEAKTVGQAMDGLKETLGNKLTPAFEVLTQKGISAIDSIASKIGSINAEELATKVGTAVDNIGKYWTALTEAFDGTGTAVSDALKAVGQAFTGITGEFGSTESIDGFKSAMQSVADVIKQIAGFAEKHAGAIANLIKWLPAIALGIKGFKIASAVAPAVTMFAKGIAGLAGKGIGAIAGKLFGISTAQGTVGKTSATSGTMVLNSAKAFALMGIAVLAVAAGFALLAYSAISLANAGGGAIAVMAGLVLALAAMGLGMALLLKSLAPMSAQLMPAATAMLAMGAAVLLVSAGFALLAATSIQLANSGGLAIGIMVGMVAAIALLAVGAAALAPALTAGAVGLIAFGAAIVLVGAGAVLAAAALAIVSAVLPTIVAYGAQGAVAIATLGASMMVFAAGAALAGAAAIVLGAGLVVAAAGILVFGAGMLIAAAGSLVMAASLKLVNSSMKSISKNAKATEKSLKSMQKSVDLVKSGLDALGSKAKSAMKKITSAFDDTESKAKSAGKKVGTGFSEGMKGGLNNAKTIAASSTVQTIAILQAGRSGAYSAGAYISLGFAQGMQSQLSAIRSAAAAMAAAAEKAVRAKAKIHSPSKVADELGSYWGEGYAGGLLGMVKEVWKAAEELVAIPQVATPNLAMAYGGELSADYDYYRNAQYTIQVPLSIDGREFAKAEATYMQDELDKKQTRDSRKLGKA